MSRIFSAGQYEQDYSPQRLGNWTQSDSNKQQRVSGFTRFSTLQPRKETTQFIVDEKGHLLPGVKKINNSFHTQLSPVETSPTRWPKPSLTEKSPPAATMGYKGIITTYLPRNQTVVKAVEVPGCKEAKY